MNREDAMNSQESGCSKDPGNIAYCIEHTLLKPEATEDDVQKLCREAEEYGFAAVCVHPAYVRLASQLLQGTSVKVCTVVGFPLGSNLPEVKAYEASRVIDKGADEIDMVINIGALKSGEDELVYRDIQRVVEVSQEEGVVVKVIIETSYLTKGEKVEACRLACRAGADFVKTSTGLGPGGATVRDVILLRETVVGSSMGVKAAGGIRTYKDAKKMIEAGATRIGTHAGVQIIKESRGEER